MWGVRAGERRVIILRVLNGTPSLLKLHRACFQSHSIPPFLIYVSPVSVTYSFHGLCKTTTIKYKLTEASPVRDRWLSKSGVKQKQSRCLTFQFCHVAVQHWLRPTECHLGTIVYHYTKYHF